MNDLLNCPFCGGKAEVETRTTLDGFSPPRDVYEYAICCDVCDFEMTDQGTEWWSDYAKPPPEVKSDLETKKALIAKWNKRKITDYQKVAAILAFDIDMMKELAEEEPTEALDFLRELYDHKEAALKNPHDRYASMQFLLDISRRQ